MVSNWCQTIIAWLKASVFKGYKTYIRVRLPSSPLLKPLILLYFQGFQSIENWFQIILHHFETL
nr:MAG TPA: hypothetical protein [Caudoviricetes sp.]